MDFWRRIGPLLAVVLVLTPLLALAPVSLPPSGGVQEVEAAPTFYLPWKSGQSWHVTADNASANHNDPKFYPDLNRFAFDAQPLGADPTVVAIAGGEVIAAVNTIQYSEDQAYKEANSGGNCVAIDHGGGVYSAYAHMETGSVPVQVGQRVEAGQPIGRAGRTGFVFANSPLLHWTATSTRPDSRCLNGLSSPSTYADVGGDGIPRAGNAYTSGNSEAVTVAEPAAPAELPAPTATLAPAETPVPTETAAPTETSAPTETPVVTEATEPVQVIAPGEAAVPTKEVATEPPAGSEQRTWTASVQVVLCDESGSCQAGAGIVVNISLASGEWMGSCTTSEPMPTPWDVYISTCTVEGLPYYEDFVATQDPSTMPEGYVPSNDPQTLHVEDIHPGGGDEATFMFTNVRRDAGASTSSSTETSATGPAGTSDPMSLLPSSVDVPGGLVETGRRTRALEEVAGNYTDPAETTQLFTAWGWQGNAVASFALPSGQEAQSGQVNGVYVSIHRFAGADEARAALDFSLTEQAAGTSLQEITISPIGEHTRALYGPMDYGNETTVLTQQGRFFIRVSAAMLDDDPTADAVAVTETILLNVTAQQTMTIDQDTSGTTGSANTPDSGNSSGTGGLMVEVWDNRNNMRDTTSQCVQLAGVTEMLCSYDSPDGLIQFDGIPAGTYEICVTRRSEVPAGEPYWSWARSLGPVSVTIAPGSHEAITLYVFMVFQNPDPGDPTLCGFDPRTSDSNGSASSDTGGAVITSDTSGSAITPDSGTSTDATLLMTFRGCPEGFDPNTDDFWSECTIPLDAPDNAFLDYHGEGQGGMSIAWMDRQHNGEYVYNAGPMTMNVELYGLAPVVRDHYRVFGADSEIEGRFVVDLVDGETREVFVFYYYE
jgi:hypothetical protein